ncbi:PLP-dependent aminotransferase family protein [Spongiactinospora sp. TRM90649]|uniref:MocR-like pyridoxine biosynthesis transcription factor PdxR n=1 Tax=Spongiactinospora sp. TRM90649 TaxID=3031114 RepID=UPI0023F657AE|nr:PLP-dependent aminotransferase family protein [Spongiactinospora sp. TRM90649]MDF5754732.1 PLP-dependent aminotransferase family protein [Spongiactinospora sp. TRM90649]
MADLHLSVDRTSGGVTSQIAGELRTAVREGRLSPGARLPASRDLARDLGVSRGVVVEAYERLVAEGFLISRVGSGTRVAPAAGTRPRAQEAISDQPYYGERATTPDLTSFPRERWMAALRHALATMPNEAFDYPDPGGVPELRRELAAYLRRVRAADAEPEDVIVAGGVAQGLSMVVRLLANDAGGHVRLAVEDPTTNRQVPLLTTAGARLVHVPVDEEGIDVAALARSGARYVLLTPAHQYPTGVVLSPGRRAELMAWAAARGAIVLEDDYDAEFRFDRDPVGCLQGLDPRHVALCGSVSKPLAPGLRLGWIVAPPQLSARLRQARADLDLGSPVIEQYALAHVIRSGQYDRHLRRMRREYRRRRDAFVTALATHLPELKVRGVAAGLHVYVELPPGLREETVAEVARIAGITAEAVGPMRGAGPGDEAAVVVGFAKLPAHRAEPAVRCLAEGLHTGP